MLHQLIGGKVFYKVFDKEFKESTGIYSLNKAKIFGKIKEAITNQTIVKTNLKSENMLILTQVHGNAVLDADLITDFTIEPEGDAAVTTKNNIILTVQTADCVPLLVSDIQGQVIGCAHCGWKGAQNNIISALIDKMKLKGAKEFLAYIGPSIKQFSYEVGQEFYDKFLLDSTNNKRFFIASTKPEYYFFDLPAFIINKLNELNIFEIQVSKEDTYSNPEKYDSYRYKIHNNIKYVTTILSTIVKNDYV